MDKNILEMMNELLVRKIIEDEDLRLPCALRFSNLDIRNKVGVVKLHD